jgi:hypothetical protein
VTALVGVLLIVAMSVVAIAIDGGLLLDYRRKVQASADAAALAAAWDLFNNYGTNSGLDPSGTANDSGLATAAANGFNNDADDDALTDPNDAGKSVVTVNIPPLSGPFQGQAGYAEVIIQYYQSRGFSGLFGSGNIEVTARAVARGHPGNIGILILDSSLSEAAEIDGNVNILNGGQIYVNSSDAAGTVVATTSKLSTGGLNLVGGLDNKGSITYTEGGGLKTGLAAVADPLANIPEPTTAGLVNQGSVSISADTTLQPGIYTNIVINSGAVTMAPGLYYFANGGSLQLKGGSLSGTGVLIFDDTGGDNMINHATAPVDITPPTPTRGGTWPTGTTSATYNGISFWIPRTQTKEVHIENTCNLNMPGTWYAQAGEYDIRPDGASTVFNIGNYICDQAEWGQGFDSKGKSNGILNMNPPSAAPTWRPILVE